MVQGQGRGSAVAMTLIVCLLILHPKFTRAAVYTVGGVRGWGFDSASWPGGKRFRAGDTLVFNYNPAFHNVVVVPRSAYLGCTTPTGAKVYQTGNDKVMLVRGPNYFICNFPGHCQSGMKEKRQGILDTLSTWLAHQGTLVRSSIAGSH
ncbi:hypothetical protein SAY86_001114 [Trapa natans]|uniref:Basic blue protein n=1 Tax=Trapa natans TaxID=22666 RepID=A0AAN7N0C7_TRANT|nr:hypothetical protein SAY86_001114 [Trapa natans]